MIGHSQRRASKSIRSIRRTLALEKTPIPIRHRPRVLASYLYVGVGGRERTLWL